MKFYFALLVAAVCIFGMTTAAAQARPDPSTPARCSEPAEIGPLHLYGLWHAEFEGLPQGATLLFERHPELAGSVRGGVNRSGTRTLAAGDVEQGEFTLEESPDGQHISATWLGTVVALSCGKEIKGLWNNTSSPISYPFVLRKLPGWH